MRILAAAPASEGLVYPLVGIGHALRARGHEVWFATGDTLAPVVEAEGFSRVAHDPIVEQAATVRLWAYPPAVAVQATFLRRAIDAHRIELVLAHTLSLAALIAAEATGVAIVVLGLAVWLWPAPGESPDSPRAQRRVRRVAETVRLLQAARLESGLPGEATADHLLGDRFLLQSAPPYRWSEPLPVRVREVGPCSWEPAAADPELAAFLARGRGPVIYAQPSRTFGEPGFWPVLVEAMRDEEVRVVASLGRLDDRDRVDHLPSHFLARPNVPQGRVLPHASMVATTGHSTSFLGAMQHGVPLLVIPHGSGTEDIAELVEERELGRALDGSGLDRTKLLAAARDLISDGARRDRLRASAAAIEDGCARAAVACVEPTRP